MDSINDSEIQIPGFSIVRCDRLLRERVVEFASM